MCTSNPLSYKCGLRAEGFPVLVCVGALIFPGSNGGLIVPFILAVSASAKVTSFDFMNEITKLVSYFECLWSAEF